MHPRRPARAPRERAPSHGSTSSTTPSSPREASTPCTGSRLQAARHPRSARARRRPSRFRTQPSTGCTGRSRKRFPVFPYPPRAYCDGVIHTSSGSCSPTGALPSFAPCLAVRCSCITIPCIYSLRTFAPSPVFYCSLLQIAWSALPMGAAFGNLTGWLAAFSHFSGGESK